MTRRMAIAKIPIPHLLFLITANSQLFDSPLGNRVDYFRDDSNGRVFSILILPMNNSSTTTYPIVSYAKCGQNGCSKCLQPIKMFSLLLNRNS